MLCNSSFGLSLFLFGPEFGVPAKVRLEWLHVETF